MSTITEPIYLEAGLAARLEDFINRNAFCEDRSALIGALIKAAIDEVDRGAPLRMAFTSAAVDQGVKEAEEKKKRLKEMKP